MPLTRTLVLVACLVTAGCASTGSDPAASRRGASSPQEAGREYVRSDNATLARLSAGHDPDCPDLGDQRFGMVPQPGDHVTATAVRVGRVWKVHVSAGRMNYATYDGSVHPDGGSSSSEDLYVVRDDGRYFVC